MDDPNEPYSDTDEELMVMDVPEPTKPSPEPSKQSGLYGLYKDKVVPRKLGRESAQEQGRRRSEANRLAACIVKG